ncbi:hypothetical protein BDQ17DRAFT_1541215 [Cyathus striatus]|nr:hypothetical protein BDQ17DRAFT_1541215 [Cyathus striatus]
MLTIFSLFYILFALAGRVLSLNITVNNKNYTSIEILAFDASLIPGDCNGQVSAANSTLSACNEDTLCLCKSETFQPLLDAETCMFNALIAENKPMPDFRVGSNPVLAGYSTACANSNATLNNTQTALTLPANWDGPLDIVLPTGGTVIAVMVGGMLGVGSLLLLSNM